MKKVILTASQQASLAALIVCVLVQFPAAGAVLLHLFPGAAWARGVVTDGCVVTAAMCRALSPRADGKINGVPLRLVPPKLRWLWGAMQDAYSEQQAVQGGAASDAATAAALQSLPGAKQVVVAAQEAETLVQKAAPVAAVVLPITQEAISLLPPKSAEEAQAILKNATGILQQLGGMLGYVGGMTGPDIAPQLQNQQLQKTPVFDNSPVPIAQNDNGVTP